VVVAAARPLQVGDDGHVGPAQLQPLASGRDALAGAGTLDLVSGRTTTAHGRRCLAGGDVRFQSKQELTGQSLYALVSYEVEGREARPGRIEPVAHGRSGAIALDRPSGHELVNLGRTVRISVPSGARACVRSMAVGWLGSNGR
jgi:hypothetical protein